jgi:hypothetical protein
MSGVPHLVYLGSIWEKFQNLKIWIKNEHDLGISVNFCNVDVVSCWRYEHNAFCEETFVLWNTILKDAEYTLQRNEWLHFCVRRQTCFWYGCTFLSGDIHTIDVAPLMCQETRHTSDVAPLVCQATEILLMWLHFCVRRQLHCWCGSTFASGGQTFCWCGSTLVSVDRNAIDVAPLLSQATDVLLMWFHFRIRTDILLMWLFLKTSEI